MLFMLALTGSMEVKAQDTSDFHFNSGVRYSQWVTKSRMNSFYRNTTADGFAVYDAEGNKTADGKAVLDYVPGLVAKAIVENVQYYSQFDWAQSWALPFFYSMAGYCNGYYNNVTESGGSLDNLNATKMFFGMYELTNTGGAYASKSIASSTKSNAQTALSKAMNGFVDHNNRFVIGTSTPAYTAGHKIVNGGWWHKSQYENEMWLDGSYMGPALFAQLRSYKGSDIIGDDWTIVYRQIQALWEMCWNPTDKLLYHAFSAKSLDNYSATWAGFDPDNGVFHSASYWGRACGWYLLALVDILEQMDKAGLTGTDNYNTLKSHLADLCEGLAARQDAVSGCWYQILDEDGEFSANSYSGKSFSTTYNYLESSASALFTAGYLKALRLGYIPTATYEPVAKKAYAGLVNNFFAADGNEGVHLFGSCRSAGVGGTSGKMPRDGSKAYYLLGGDVTRVAKSFAQTEGKILGAFILAATEYEKKYQDNTVLFEKDLAPSYDLEAGDEISCPATGSGANITYQWYRDGEPVEGATSATIVPTASGAYYCKATSGSTTITSSTAQVTVANPSVKYTVKFYDGSTELSSSKENEGTEIEAPATSPVKEGYTFKGWALENGSTARVLFPYEVWSDVNFYAVWSEDTGGGSGEDEEIYLATATATLTVDAGASNQEITLSNADISGGKMYVYNGQTSDKDLIKTQGGVVAFQMPNNNTFFKVTLDNALMAGDKIKADIFGPKKKGSTTNPRGLWLTTATSRPDDAPAAVLSVTNSSTSDDAWMTSEEYTVKTGDGICGEKTFYIYRETGNGTFFTDFTVTTSSAPIGDEFTLDATTDYENFDDYVGEGKNVTFKRSFTANNWSTLVLPFSASAEQVTSAFGETCKIAKIKSMSVTGGKGEIRLTDVSEITANEPVLVMIIPNATDEYMFEGVTVVAPTSVVSTSTDGKVEMHGVYETTSYTQISEDAYFLSGGKFYDWSWMNAMSPFSAYLLPVGENKPSSLSISMEETGIENVNANGNVNDNVNWNLAGQRVTKEYKGIKIVNGKKVF